MTIDDAPPPGYAVRRPIPDDLATVAAFLAAVTAAEFGAPDYPEANLRDDWEGLDLATDAWLVLALDGTVAGYAALYREAPDRLEADGYVHPAHVGRGLGTFVVRTMEARAREQVPLAPPGVRVLLDNTVNPANSAARQILERADYAAVRYFWRMVADLATPPSPPTWPAGITVRPWQSAADDEPAHLALEEAFRDHWDHAPTDFETWRRKGEHFDPGLWFLAFDGTEIAGVLAGRYHLGMGWIQQLGVRRPWRKRGLGLALLQHAFAEFHRRGWSRVGLDVDSESETGATRLYERAGMQVAPGHAYAVYRKELRPGTEYAPPGEDT